MVAPAHTGTGEQQIYIPAQQPGEGLYVIGKDFYGNLNSGKRIIRCIPIFDFKKWY